MKSTSINLESNAKITIPDIKEALRMIGIKEATANVFTLPKKLSNKK